MSTSARLGRGVQHLAGGGVPDKTRSIKLHLLSIYQPDGDLPAPPLRAEGRPAAEADRSPHADNVRSESSNSAGTSSHQPTLTVTVFTSPRGGLREGAALWDKRHASRQDEH
jgi:hypothetical protein